LCFVDLFTFINLFLYAMRKFVIITLLFCIIASIADAQVRKRKRGGFARKKPPYRYELIGSLGGANILGDLGGADQIGTHGLKDLELALTRPALGVSIRIKPELLGPYFSVKSNLYWGIIRGDDKLTNEPFRHRRNLNFKSPIIELSSQLEFGFMKEQKGRIYRIKGVRGMRHKERQVYLFAGGGGFYFNPKGEYNGKWYALQPIGTEGQGRIPGKKKYSRIQPLVMLGGGTRFAINRYWGIGFELGARYTFTDYLDDVSGKYPDPKIFNGDPIATYLSNPSDNTVTETPGVDDRGHSKDKDVYMFATFTIGYKVIYRKRSRSKF
jgi:hypothetical protein